MLKDCFHDFVEHVVSEKIITSDDVRLLQRDLLPHGLSTREEADILISLDRAVPVKCEEWADYLVATVVDFVVWSARPTARIDADKARWLLASLKAGIGPTENAVRIAFECVREADFIDEAMSIFLMNASRDRSRRQAMAATALMG
jgi:hypothetical protein